MMNTESASMGTVVDSHRVASLPVSYGNPFLLIGLSAGVTYNGSIRLDRPFEPTHIVNFSMGGISGLLNDITIDGAPTTSRANPLQVTASYVPPTDIVQEFKVQTATFDAQFGQTQGGVTNISIKSGTNLFHGDASYSFQRPSFWANDFFNNKAIPYVPRPDFCSIRGADRSAVRWRFRTCITGRTRPSSCSGTREYTIPAPVTTTPPTPFQPLPSAPETFRACLPPAPAIPFRPGYTYRSGQRAVYRNAIPRQ